MFLQNYGILNYSSVNYLSILLDGNTAAWYDSTVSDTITKDSLNRVNGWANNISYSEGAEMIDQANWYKLTYWDTHDACWSQSGSALASNGGVGYLTKNNFWVIGKIYKVTMSITLTSGVLRPANCNDTFISVNTTLTLTYFVVVTTTTMYNYSNFYVGTITSLSIKEVTVNNNPLIQYTLTYMPTINSNGILFDGANDVMISTFTFNQPEMIYIVFKQVSWVANGTIFDGSTALKGWLNQNTVTPNIRTYAGSAYSTQSSALSIGSFGIVRVLFNGVNSKFIVNNNTPITGSWGTNNMGGLSLGARVNALFGNMQVKEIILRKVKDSSTDETTIYNYLQNKYFLNFSYPTVLTDNNTVGWYISDATGTTVVLTTGNTVSIWRDMLGSGHDLIQATPASQPLWNANGITFDGTNDFMKTVAFTYNQPEMIYLIAKQVTWTYQDTFFDGNTANLGKLAQYNPAPTVYSYANQGTVKITDSDWSLDTFAIIRILFNGVTSSLQVNNGIKYINDAGAANMGGFTLGANGSNTGWGNMQVKEIVLRKVKDSSTDETAIYNYLQNKYFLNFSYPSVLVDGNTVGWYISDATGTTVALTTGNTVSAWVDTLGSGHNLLQATTTKQPLWSTNGILFDGVDDYMKTVAFTYNQPEMIYIVVNQITATSNDTLFDGNTLNTGRVYQSGNLVMYNGAGSQLIRPITLGTFQIMRCLFNGSQMTFQINNITKTSGSCGLNNMGGFTLGANGSNTGWGNMQVKEIVLRNVADNPTDETAIYNYLSSKYGI